MSNIISKAAARLYNQSSLKRLGCVHSRFIRPAILNSFNPNNSNWNPLVVRRACSIHVVRVYFGQAPPPEKYNWIDGVEYLERYRPGGYHPVMIGDVLGDSYLIIEKLGDGANSTVWLARDAKNKRYVALKVNVSGSDQPRQEVEILKALSKSPYLVEGGELCFDMRNTVPQILDDFEVSGPNGTHVCRVVAPAGADLGRPSLGRLFSIQVARALAGGLATCLSFVHARGFVHGEVDLRNVMTKVDFSLDDLSVEEFYKKYGQPATESITRVDGKPITTNVPLEVIYALGLQKESRSDFTLADAGGILLNDFGEAFDPNKQKRLGKYSYIPMPWRPPEASFEPDSPISYPFDIWGLAGAIWEILGIRYVFDSCESRDIQIDGQLAVLGSEEFPPEWESIWERPKSENGDGDENEDRRPRKPDETDLHDLTSLDDRFEEFIQKAGQKEQRSGTFEDDEKRAILNLMRGMFKFNPEKRLTIQEVLESEWMVRWALPEFYKSLKAEPDAANLGKRNKGHDCIYTTEGRDLHLRSGTYFGDSDRRA